MGQAEKTILELLDQGELAPSAILQTLSDAFDETTLREALLNLVTQQQTEWTSARRLRRRSELPNG
jgi:hypothetical protein